METDFHGQVAGAFDTSRDILLELTDRAKLLENEPVISHSIKLRKPYTDVLDLLLSHQAALCQRKVSEFGGVP